MSIRTLKNAFDMFPEAIEPALSKTNQMMKGIMTTFTKISLISGLLSLVLFGCASSQARSSKSPGVSDTTSPVPPESSASTGQPPATIQPPPGNAQTSVGTPGNQLPTLYVVFGGNGTCITQIQSSRFRGLWENRFFFSFEVEIVDAGRVNAQSEILFFCFENLSDKMYFYSSKEPDKSMRPIDQSEVGQIVRARIPNYNYTNILGHSYGGWRALKLASEVAGTSAPGKISLVTVDPISKTLCTQPVSPACRQAPQDITLEEGQLLSKRVRWLNYYQIAQVGLGSGPIPYAQGNTEVSATHFGIVTDEDMWIGIRQWIP